MCACMLHMQQDFHPSPPSVKLSNESLSCERSYIGGAALFGRGYASHFAGSTTGERTHFVRGVYWLEIVIVTLIYLGAEATGRDYVCAYNYVFYPFSYV